MVNAVSARRTRILSLACVAALASLSTAAAQTDSARAFTVDDVLRLETLGRVAASPDGKRVAIVVERARTERERYPMPFLQGDARGDIWIARTDSGPALRLTNGGVDGAGYWDPVWSPDGRRLAMLSNAGDGAVRAYVWTVPDSAPRAVSARPVDRSVVSHGGEEQFQPLAWSDDSTLVLLLLPADTGLDSGPLGRTVALAERAWHAVRTAGTHATASVLESIPGTVPEYLAREDLIAINVETRSARHLATLPRDPTTSGRRGVTLAPSGHVIAVATSELEPPVARERLTRSMVHYRIGLVDDRRQGLRWLGDFVGSDDGAGGPPSLRWAPDGHALVILGRRAGTPPDSPCAFVVDVGDRPTGSAGPSRTRASGTAWSMPHAARCSAGTWAGNDAVLIQAQRDDGGSGLWLVSATLPPRDLTSVVGGGVPLLIASPTRVVAIARDRSWSIDSRGAQEETLANGAHQRPVLWTASSTDGPSRAVIVGQPTDAGDSLRAVSLAGDHLRLVPLAVLRPGWRVVAYLPDTRTVIAQDGNRAVAALSSAGEHTLLGINAWAARLASPVKRALRYRSDDGDSLTALVVLPPSYVPGHRYPVVTWVYVGMVYADTALVDVDPFNASQLNLGLLAAEGYVVLLPSMPIADHAHVLAEMTGTVLPAVDRLVASGIADPDRVAVMGQSFGGYSTLGLITQTHRFRSAIALAVISDFLSAYGTYRPWDRYRSDAQVTLATPKMDEAGQPGLGASPWADPWRYFMNSPVLFADRVQTPVMIMQGDLDFEGPEQAEEFFTALYRLGKRAELVRYVGEQHVIESPANVRDMWTRILGWLTETMGPTLSSAQATDHTPLH